MSRLFWGIALGAASAFMLDPQQGRRRRALLRDKVLVQRVRSRLVRYVSHPSAVEVMATGGNVVLRGDVLAGEHDDLVSAVAAVRGVRDVADRLDVHESPEEISVLQGGEHWTPGIRALAGGGAALLFLYGLVRGGITGLGAIVLGSAVLARALGNEPLGERVEEGRARLEERARP